MKCVSTAWQGPQLLEPYQAQHLSDYGQACVLHTSCYTLTIVG